MEEVAARRPVRSRRRRTLPRAGSGPAAARPGRRRGRGRPKRWRPRPLHVNSRAASASTPGEQLPEVLVGRGGVPDVELHGLADVTCSPTASAPELSSAPSRLRTRKSPRLNSALCSSTTSPTCRPPRSSSRSSSEAAPASSCRRSIAGLPPSSSMRFCSARVTTYGLADRAAALRDERAHLDAAAVDEHADRALGEDAVVEHEAVPARAARRRRQPADDLEAGEVAVDCVRRNASTGNVNGSANSSRLAGGRSSDGQPVERGAVGRLLHPKRDRRERRCRRDGPRSTVSAGSSSISWAPPVTATAVPPSEHARLEDVAQRRSDVLERADVMRDAKHTARSHPSPSRRSRISPAASPTACVASGCCDSADANALDRRVTLDGRSGGRPRSSPTP